MLVVCCSFNPKTARERGLIQHETMKANWYRNKLMELYLKKINRFRELRLLYFPECGTLLSKVQIQEQLLKDKRLVLSEVLRQNRDEHPLTQEVRELRTALYTARNELKNFLKPLEKSALEPGNVEFKRRFTESGVTSPHGKAKLRKELVAQMLQEDWHPFWKASKQLEEQYILDSQILRKNCDLSVGTYLSVENSHESAIKKSKGDPVFKAYRGDGRIGHQCKDKPSQDMIQITLLQDEQSLRKKWGWARFNIGKVSNPVWVEGRICLENFREDVPIKWVYLVVRRTGLHVEYEIQFTVATDRQYQYGQGVAAVNIGWRRLPSGDVRVGFVVDEFGLAEEIRIPSQIIERERYAQRLESFCKRHYNVFHEYLCRHLKDDFPGKPTWMQEQIETIHAWKAHGRLARLAMAWEREHFADIKALWTRWKAERLGASPKKDLIDSPEVIYHWAEMLGFPHPLLFVMHVWRKKDEHLVNGYACGKARLQRRRRDLYLTTSKKLSEKYAVVIVGPYNTKDLIKKPSIEEDRRTVQDERASSIRQISAPGLLKECLLRFGNTEEGITKDITLEHYECGGFTKSDPRKDILCECSKCGQFYDQDYNAALNLLKRARARLKEGLPPGKSSSSLAAE